MPRFQSINEIPVRLRKLRHSQLSLAQIEQILEAADSSSDPFPEALAEAQNNFMAAHVERDGVWIKTQGGK